MSNKTPITQNTVELQDILATIYNLPEAGGGNAKEEQEKSLDVTENGNYDILPDSGKVLSKATVNVNVPERYNEGYSAGKEDGYNEGYPIGKVEGYNEGYQKGFDDNKPVVEPLEVTKNGTYTPSGDVDGYNSVSVNVPIPDGYIVPNGTKEITENGTHDVTEYASVNVNVPTSGGNSEEEVAALLSNTLTVLDNSIVTSLKTRACQASTALVSANLPSVTSLGSYAFYQATGLETVKLPKLTTVSTQVFYGCTKLKHADCGLLGNLPAQTFNACSALTELILRKSNAICTLSNVNAINNTPIGKGTGYVYVPSALKEDYASNTNWSAFANQIRAIEDYPDICGGVS